MVLGPFVDAILVSRLGNPTPKAPAIRPAHDAQRRCPLYVTLRLRGAARLAEFEDGFEARRLEGEFVPSERRVHSSVATSGA
jgi:hypothetical protein